MNRNITANWKEYLSSPRNRIIFYSTLPSLIFILFLLTRFLNYIETRNGFIPYDPVLAILPPVNLTWLIFSVIYISLFTAVFTLLKSPERLSAAMQCYFFMVLFRITAMYIVPFNPPAEMIPLNDPFVEIFGTGRLLTKDLFFSGHTATLLIFYYTAVSKKLKTIFLICTIIVAVSVLLQHVHYTVDVLGAVIFTSLSYVIVRKINPNFYIVTNDSGNMEGEKLHAKNSLQTQK